MIGVSEQPRTTRRDFLKGLAAGIAAGAIASAGVAAGIWPKPAPPTTVTKTVPTTVTETRTAPTTVTETVPTTVTETKTVTAPAPPAAKVPFERKTIRLTVNGEEYLVDVDVRDTLAYVLREKLGLTGTKIGCDEGTCGACTVLMNGKPILSCMTLAVECEGNEILTIEGLSKDGKLHPIQQAFVEKHGLQCGFCTPGMILSAKALLDKNPNPSEEDIKKAISGNICRCGNYVKIVESIKEAARKMRGG